MSATSETLVSKISLIFARKYRVTLLIFLTLIGLGFFSYTTLLKREGLPDFAYPLVFVQAQYQGQTPQETDSEVTQPIERALKRVEGIKQVDSVTSEMFSSVIINFESEYDPREAAEMVESALAESEEIASAARINILPFEPYYDGKHGFLMALTNDKNPQELQEIAIEFADDLEALESVEEANSINLINLVSSPQTGEMLELQTTYNRVGQKVDGELVFDDSILIGVVKKEGVSDKDLSTDIRTRVDELEDSDLLRDVEVVYSEDMAVYVDEQISSLESNAISALLAVILVLFLFVNWRASIVTAVFIPTVMAATFLGLLIIGYSLNIIVLFGLILVLGLFVDDAIVVVETIDYHKRNGVRGLEAIRKGINAIGVADVMGTLTTVIAFSPMVLISGILGEFIRPIPITVILSLFVSLVIALTVIPFLSYVLIPNKKETQPRKVFAVIDVVLNGFNRKVIEAGEVVSRFIGWYTEKWYRLLSVIMLSIFLVVLGGFYAGKLKFAVFPPQKDSDGLTITINYSNGQDVQEKKQIALEVESILKQNYENVIDGVDYLFVGVNQFGIDQAVLDVSLIDMSERELSSVEIAEDIDDKVKAIQGALISSREYQVGAPGEEYSYKMQVYSENSEKLETIAIEVVSFIENEVELEGQVEVVDARYDYVDTIAKKGGERYVEILAKISDPTNSGALSEIDSQVKKEFDNQRLEEFGFSTLDLGFDKGMESENMEAFESAGVALLIAMVLIYLLLVIQFDSFSLPLLVFSAFPFSFPGLFPGLYFTDNALSFFVMVGVIALVGIVVNNTIMLLDFAIQAKQSAQNDIDKAIVEAIKIRFRPLVTTSITTVVGLLPLALTDPLWESIALTIVFGLISSTLMVIFVFPAYYVVVERVRSGVKRVVGRLVGST